MTETLLKPRNPEKPLTHTHTRALWFYTYSKPRNPQTLILFYIIK